MRTVRPLKAMSWGWTSCGFTGSLGASASRSKHERHCIAVDRVRLYPNIFGAELDVTCVYLSIGTTDSNIVLTGGSAFCIGLALIGGLQLGCPIERLHAGRDPRESTDAAAVVLLERVGPLCCEQCLCQCSAGVKREQVNAQQEHLHFLSMLHTCCVATAHLTASAGSWNAIKNASPSVVISYLPSNRTQEAKCQ